MNIQRVIVLILDACGIGAMPDADRYDDLGSATIPHIAQKATHLRLNHLQALGLGNIADIDGIKPTPKAGSAFGKMATISEGKDSTVGHWEIAGIVTEKAFPIFPDGFPSEFIKKLESEADIKTIGNFAASGTDIIEQLGQRHVETEEIIVYTSADSVFQIAAHEDIFPIERLYAICRIARDLLQNDLGVSRVIARPFHGESGNFIRTSNRKDFSLEPPRPNLLSLITETAHKTLAIGKIYDLFNGSGITNRIKTNSNQSGLVALHLALQKDQHHKFIFVNLVDFDMLWGHRRDVNGFAESLMEFDEYLPKIIASLRDDDLLLITADHGCDPTYTKHTDHTREYVPLFACGPRVKTNYDLGTRATFSDIAKTVADIFSIENNFAGQSFAPEIIKS